MEITAQQIHLMLEGIEDGLTIEQCCKHRLGVSRDYFYRHATKEQIDAIKTHKFLYSSVNASYVRIKSKGL